jgi:hypothetical protein
MCRAKKIWQVWNIVPIVVECGTIGVSRNSTFVVHDAYMPLLIRAHRRLAFGVRIQGHLAVRQRQDRGPPSISRVVKDELKRS